MPVLRLPQDNTLSETLSGLAGSVANAFNPKTQAEAYLLQRQIWLRDLELRQQQLKMQAQQQATQAYSGWVRPDALPLIANSILRGDDSKMTFELALRNMKSNPFRQGNTPEDDTFNREMYRQITGNFWDKPYAVPTTAGQAELFRQQEAAQEGAKAQAQEAGKIRAQQEGRTVHFEDTPWVPGSMQRDAELYLQKFGPLPADGYVPGLQHTNDYKNFLAQGLSAAEASRKSYEKVMQEGLPPGNFQPSAATQPAPAPVPTSVDAASAAARAAGVTPPGGSAPPRVPAPAPAPPAPTVAGPGAQAPTQAPTLTDMGGGATPRAMPAPPAQAPSATTAGGVSTISRPAPVPGSQLPIPVLTKTPAGQFVGESPADTEARKAFMAPITAQWQKAYDGGQSAAELNEKLDQAAALTKYINAGGGINQVSMHWLSVLADHGIIAGDVAEAKTKLNTILKSELPALVKEANARFAGPEIRPFTDQLGDSSWPAPVLLNNIARQQAYAQTAIERAQDAAGHLGLVPGGSGNYQDYFTNEQARRNNIGARVKDYQTKYGVTDVPPDQLQTLLQGSGGSGSVTTGPSAPRGSPLQPPPQAPPPQAPPQAPPQTPPQAPPSLQAPPSVAGPGAPPAPVMPLVTGPGGQEMYLPPGVMR